MDALYYVKMFVCECWCALLVCIVPYVKVFMWSTLCIDSRCLYTSAGVCSCEKPCVPMCLLTASSAVKEDAISCGWNVNK